ncbi:hypothetical protein Ping_3560 [Psychromonas ingrahamii 37]|uniref:Uncharacterized protein n=1 Tax=Psychromonas ingrahamii (strain DSM 17664 / CCUG 51855 / 37) TaxID=357804 RepID=A1T0H8_PSYIN|nr:hypothetical protein [Psychromonas ingrahamii]ABM05243.1 hypothetical protein Ping_3560 [Psychromonas ingrahamii 37]
MANVRIQFPLDPKNSNEKAALTELKKWKILFDDGQTDLCLLKQRETLLAGLYLQKIMPDLAEKLAQNLSSASLDELDFFYSGNAPVSHQEGINNQQKEVLAALQRLQESVDSKMSSVIPANASIVAYEGSQKVEAESSGAFPAAQVTEIISADKLALVRKIKAKKIF